jgi:glyoxylase-like metal-dependent hydrolase (beta-lactamase superfamily II)/rhodanese-related sulfurtransferase
MTHRSRRLGNVVEVLTLDTPELGDRSYLVHDGHEAIVIDPQRDIDWLLALADSAKVSITCVAETHIHNDYVSGGWALARGLGARYLVASDDKVRFERQPVGEGDRVEVGSMTLETLATPGHTPSHLAFLIWADREPWAAFSGGSLLYGAVGRTDLISPAMTVELAHAQHRSARWLAALPEELHLFPTHGFGSFCTSGPATQTGAGGTIGAQRSANPAVVEDEEEFVRRLVAGYSPYPRYYAHMGGINREGAAPADLSLPPEVDVDEVGRRIAAGDRVIDLRPGAEFGPSHVAGTVNFPNGDLLATYVGWVIPWGSPLTLAGSSPESVARARRDLARIGADWLAGWCPAPLAELQRELGSSSYLVTDFAGLARAAGSGEIQVLDARRPDEWRGRHIRDAINIHLPDLLDRLGELPQRPTWVHCGAGYRASVAASLLDRAGREAVLVGDDISRIAESGLDLVSGSE